MNFASRADYNTHLIRSWINELTTKDLYAVFKAGLCSPDAQGKQGILNIAEAMRQALKKILALDMEPDDAA